MDEKKHAKSYFSFSEIAKKFNQIDEKSLDDPTEKNYNLFSGLADLSDEIYDLSKKIDKLT